MTTLTKTAPERPAPWGGDEWRRVFVGVAGGYPLRFLNREIGNANFAPSRLWRLAGKYLVFSGCEDALLLAAGSFTSTFDIHKVDNKLFSWFS